ncbi:MAG: hypothetical protein ACRDS1_11460 [Pseudonocardiaceae bacterium]
MNSCESCPYCGATSGVQPIPASSTVQACCETQWAITIVNPRPYLDRLTATMLLHQVIELADDAPRLTDRELRDRLLALAESCGGAR